jgi:sugar-phosphatase
VKAAIFDMDGLLIDSEPFWRRAEQAAFARVGIELTDAMCQETMGFRTDEVVALWYRRFPWAGVSQEEVVHDTEARVAELVRSRGRPLPGVEGAIEELRRTGYSLALASSSSRDLIDVTVATLHLEGVFSAVCSAVDEQRGKPDPAVYLTAARRLGVAPAECVAFEDAPAGVQSAKAAGMHVIAVPAPHQFDRSGFDTADMKLHSLEEFTVNLLRDL